MKKLKAAFYVFKNSLTNEHYYKELIKRDFGFSIKYIFVMALLASAITIPKIAIPLVTDFKDTLKDVTASFEGYYPEDLIITVKDGQLSINQPEPYFFPIPDDFEDLSMETESATYPENIVVFDSDGTLDDIEDYNTVVLVNSKNILIRESNSIEVYPLKDAPDGEITKEKFTEGLAAIDKVINVLPYIILVVVILASLIYYFGFRLVYLFPVAYILYLIGKGQKYPYEYKQYYMIAIHTMTLPLILEVIASVIGLSITVPFWFLVLNLIGGYIAVRALGKNNIDSQI